VKKNEPEFEDADWGIDDGYFRAYKDGFPVAAGSLEESKSDESGLHLSESARARLGELRRLEQSVSAQRRLLHARIDFIRAQATSSYAVAQQLAYLMTKERTLSDQRALLHHEIDQLRGRRHVRSSRDEESSR
jgi:hypothetical protein